MKATTQQICAILEKPELLEWYGQLESANGSHVHEESTIEESHAEFRRLSQLILSTAKREIFDDIPLKKRQNIYTHISNIYAHLQHCQRHQYGKQQCGTQINLILTLTFDVSAILEESNLFLKSLGIRSKKKLTEVLTQTLEQYNIFLSDLSESEKCFTELSEIDKQVRQIQKDAVASREGIGEVQEEFHQFLEQIDRFRNKSDTLQKDIASTSGEVQRLLGVIQNYEAEAEEKRLGIETFSKNIDEYKKNISELEGRAKAIIAKEKTINELIRSAEQALNLKSAEGISAAFASQYVKASSVVVSSLWLFMSFLFIVLAIGGTVWFALGYFTIDSHDISLIIARIVAVTIAVTAATFCDKQYIKQKNITEDYAYKAVLSKSIIAFTDKLAEKSPENSDVVTDYLKKVLEEIHRDPLRQRSIEEKQVPVITTSELFSNLPVLKELVELADKK